MTIITCSTEELGRYSLCGYKPGDSAPFTAKKEWLARGYRSGLRHDLLLDEHDNAVGGIEYAPAENAWRPVSAPGFYIIHCIYIMKKEYKGKGHGRDLLDHALGAIRQAGADGAAAVVRRGSWMSGPELFEAAGFSRAGEAPPDFTLMSLPFHSRAAVPVFSCPEPSSEAAGLILYWSDQCPYARKSVPEITAFAGESGIPLQVIKTETAEQIRNIPCAYGTFCLTLDGKVVAENPISRTRFTNIARKAGLTGDSRGL